MALCKKVEDRYEGFKDGEKIEVLPLNRLTNSF